MINKCVLSHTHTHTHNTQHTVALSPSLALFPTHSYIYTCIGGFTRCKPFEKCDLNEFCCGCDEKSFLPTTPIQLIADDGSAECGKIGRGEGGHPSVEKKDSVQDKLSHKKEQFLPLCNPRMSQAGRWINADSECESKTSKAIKLSVPFAGLLS